MALEGTLRDFSLADIFQLIGIQKKTGVLTLTYDDEVVTVSFLNGNVVSADSLKKNLEDRLGTVLVRSGRITQERLQDALRVQKETLQRLGYILVHSGFISEENLREALRLQITQIVYRLFRWKDGDYHFSQQASVEYDREHFTPLSAENILMEGIRMIDEWPIIERKIPSFDMVFRKTRPDLRPLIVARPEEDLAEDLDAAIAGRGRHETDPDPAGLRLAQEEAAIYDLIDGRRSVQDVIDRSRMGDFEVCRLLYDLLSRGLIAASQTTAAEAPRPRPARVGPFFERLAYLALAAGAAASIWTMQRSPLAGAPQLLVPPGAVERIHELVTRDRIRRIDEAVQVYHLQKGFYPDDLRELVKGRLLRETALQDPWGRTFGFLSTTGGYRIIAYDPGGVENAERSLSGGIAPMTPEALPRTREPRREFSSTSGR